MAAEVVCAKRAPSRREAMRWPVIGTLLAATAIIQLLEAAAAPNRQAGQQPRAYYGSLIGKLNRRHHNVSGEVYAVDEQTLFIRSFNYDGLAGDAYFWSSTRTSQPASQEAFIVPDEKGSTKPLERYIDKDIVLRLPEGKTLREINWLSIWSRKGELNCGEILINAQTLVTPRPLEISPLSQLAHGVKSGPITIVDAQTFLVPDFHYDGLGPAGFFWLTRGSQGLSQNGLRLKDENGSPNPLRKYSGETVVISLPDELTIYDFDYFGVWCKEFQVNFGQTKIPQQARVPPSPKMLGIKPENKLNCEILYDELGYEIRWVLDGDDIVMQLVGKIEPGEYMAFGLGKDDSRSEMANADAVVTWVDRNTGQVHAVDYFLGGKQQCSANGSPSGQASCPDVKLAGGGDSLTLLHGAIVNGYSMVTFKRPQLGVDELYDQHVYSDGQQSVIWAIGMLNKEKEVGYHRLRSRNNMFIDFARNPQWNCPIPDLNATMHNNLPITSASQVDPTVVSSPAASPDPQISVAQQQADGHQPGAAKKNGTWFIPAIVCPQDRTFYAQVGPPGGLKGFQSITGQPANGLAWYINGLLIPELVVERGQTYRFVVEGGNDKMNVNRRHPFYLTDSPDGGFDFKTDDERLKERIFAGLALRADGQFVPTAEGRLCEWRPTNATLGKPDQYSTFAAYQRSLRLECLAGQASMVKFAPDSNTPDLIYYQCYTHRQMGWRIRVVDSCAGYQSQHSRTANGNNNNNMNKRELRTLVEGEERSGSELDRRLLQANTTSDLLNGSHSEPRMSFDVGQFMANSFVAPPGQSGEFGDELAGSSHSFANELLPVDANQLPSDMIILNNSQLNQNQPMNLSSFEEVLKLSPLDLEFMDQNGPESLESFFPSATSFQTFPMPFPPAAFHSKPTIQPQHNLNKTDPKMPKKLNSYMRRLAAIYYPVQQQLASILATNPNGIQQNQTSPQAETAASQASFSLSNLVPIAKIDLTKSGFGKTLNRLRFKSGRKYEGSGAKLSAPPRPANEFNYDIFNNQLAQLRKHQKEFQALELASLTDGEPDLSSLFNSNLGRPPSPPNPPMSEEQQAIESMNFQTTQALHSLANMNHQHHFRPNSQPPPPPQMHNQHQHRQPVRMSEIPLGPPNQHGQQPYLIDYLSMEFNRTAEMPNIGAFSQQQFTNARQPNWFRAPLRENRPLSFPLPPPDNRHSIFITRLPMNEEPNFNTGQQQNNWVSPSSPLASRYPNIRPYNGQSMEFQHYQNKPPPMAYQENQAEAHKQEYRDHPEAGETQEGDNLSISGSGSHYDFRQQPTETNPTSGPEPVDHMLAIERFSKQPSERQHLSVVHPVTGENVREPARLVLNQINMTTNSQGPRFSSIMSNQFGPPPPTPPQQQSSNPHEIFDAEQTTLQPSSDLQRINSTSGDKQCRPDVACNQPIGATTESMMAQPVLVRPANFLTGMTESTTTPNQPASTDSSPPMIFSKPSPQISRFNFDPNPFTPIELSGPGTRLGPLVDAMFQSSNKLEPPVQVASYLAQQLAGLQPNMFVTSERSVASSNPMSISISLGGQQQQDNQLATGQSGAGRDLIVLKPISIAAGRPHFGKQQTFLLKPELVKTSVHNNDKQLKQTGDTSNSQSADGYSGDSPAAGARLLVGHQFDRLSSLSSSPSTSIALADPMQASNTMQISKEQSFLEPAEVQEKSPHNNSSFVPHQDNQNKRPLLVGPSKGFNFEAQQAGLELSTGSAASERYAEGNRRNPGGENANTLQRDNNTDNAILSHVMALIHSNAIPSPPIIPVASYSNADYFLPVHARNQRMIRG